MISGVHSMRLGRGFQMIDFLLDWLKVMAVLLLIIISSVGIVVMVALFPIVTSILLFIFVSLLFTIK